MSRSPLTTLCQIERGDEYLMLHRTRKEQDENKDKWIGIGGHFEDRESPEECLLREIREETGLTVTDFRFRGIITFNSDRWPVEYMCLYTAKYPEDAGELPVKDCNEGELAWIRKDQLPEMNIWEGDKIFLMLLEQNKPFFSLKISYHGDVLYEAVLDGETLELFDICDMEGQPTGKVTARIVAHRYGILHRTAHIWILRHRPDGGCDVLLQKRAYCKASFPGTYDISSAGHVGAGDEPEAAAYRELSEELGIYAKPGELIPIGTFFSGDIRAEFGGVPFFDREISHVFVYEKEFSAEDLTLQECEVDSVRWFDSGEIMGKIHEEPDLFCINERGYKLVLEYLAGQD